MEKEPKEEVQKSSEERLRPVMRMTSRRKGRSAEISQKPDRNDDIKNEEFNDDGIYEEPTKENSKFVLFKIKTTNKGSE